MLSERRIKLSSWRTVILQADLVTPEPSRCLRRLYCSTMNSSDSFEIWYHTHTQIETQLRNSWHCDNEIKWVAPNTSTYKNEMIHAQKHFWFKHFYKSFCLYFCVQILFPSGSNYIRKNEDKFSPLVWTGEQTACICESHLDCRHVRQNSQFWSGDPLYVWQWHNQWPEIKDRGIY